MTLIQIALLTTLISGFLIVTYPAYAAKKGWPIGEILSNESGIIRSLGGLLMIFSIVAIFFYFKLTVALGVLVGFAFVGFLLTLIFKTYTQALSIIGLFCGIAMGLFHYLT